MNLHSNVIIVTESILALVIFQRQNTDVSIAGNT